MTARLRQCAPLRIRLGLEDSRCCSRGGSRVLLFRRGGRRFLVRLSSFLPGLWMRITDVAGWEPIFEYQGSTLAEMDHEIKVIHSLPGLGDGADRSRYRMGCLIDTKPWSNSKSGCRVRVCGSFYFLTRSAMTRPTSILHRDSQHGL